MKDDDHFSMLFFYGPDSFDDTWETLVRKLQHNHPFLESLTVALSLQRFSPLRLDSLRSKEVASLQRNCLLPHPK